MATFQKSKNSKGLKKHDSQNDNPVNSSKLHSNNFLDNIDNTYSKTEDFIQKNQNTLTGIVIFIFIVTMGYFAYKYLIKEPKELIATDALLASKTTVESIIKSTENKSVLEIDSLCSLALNGNTNQEGLTSIIENYKGTSSANIANYYAAYCSFQLKKFEEAILYAEAFEGKDFYLKPLAYGIIGDAYIELDKFQEALNAYKNGLNFNDNSFTRPLLLYKRALVYRHLKKYDLAIKDLKEVIQDFPDSFVAKNGIAKFALGNIAGTLNKPIFY